ncbi:MAG: EAL domain-containing protein [Acidobacteriota bacterium]|nr:EAL domain-containing protein [Acidobacteriota bacterium]MDQ7087995.1 EAL domain-containing protein [Acidobacteriota bacterium]
MKPASGDDFHRLRTAFLRLRAALRDPTTGLYAYSLHFDEVRALLTRRRRVGVVWIGLGDRRLVESVYGWEAYDRLIAEASTCLAGLRGEVFADEGILAVAGVHADAFLLFTPAFQDAAELAPDSLARLADVLRDRLEVALAKAEAALPAVPAPIRVGASLIEDNPFHRFERQVYLAIDEARTLAERPRDSERLAWMAEIQRVLRERDLQAVFQPVVDLVSAAPVGLEAFVRGRPGSVLALPRVLFSVGRRSGLAGELDRLCLERIVEALEQGETPPLLFVNVTPEGLADSRWRSAGLIERLAGAGLSPSKIVLEVVEGQILGDPRNYRDLIDDLRAVGYRLSLDDMGSSARSVSLVEDLRPEFIKFDFSLLRGAGSEPLQRELIRSLVSLAGRAGARLVAERIESEEERDFLVDCGARWGQGYYFAREGAPAAYRPGAAGRPA